MKRVSTTAALLLTAAIAAPQADAGCGARACRHVRQALGGDAAIAAVQTFSVSGTESRNLGGALRDRERRALRRAARQVRPRPPYRDAVFRRQRRHAPASTATPACGSGSRAFRIHPVRTTRRRRCAPKGTARRSSRGKQAFSRLAIALIGLAGDLSHWTPMYEGASDARRPQRSTCSSSRQLTATPPGCSWTRPRTCRR